MMRRPFSASRSRGSNPGSFRTRGFTLLEMLVAVTLLALLVALAYGTLRTAVRAMRSGEALITRTDRLRTTQEFLRRQLSHAMPLPFERLEDTGENRVFVADREELRFVAPMPGHLSRGGPHVQWLTLDDDALLFDHAQLNGYDPADPKAGNKREPVVLLEGIREARFEFRELDPETGELGEWESDWEDAQRLPLLVRLNIEFDEESRQHWPDLEIPLLVATAMPGMFGFNAMPGQVEFPRDEPPPTDPPPPGGDQ
jgi:general secretion pathway protein J